LARKKSLAGLKKRGAEFAASVGPKPDLKASFSASESVDRKAGGELKYSDILHPRF